LRLELSLSDSASERRRGTPLWKEDEILFDPEFPFLKFRIERGPTKKTFTEAHSLLGNIPRAPKKITQNGYFRQKNRRKNEGFARKPRIGKPAKQVTDKQRQTQM
jgi:hypothetical protein